MLDLQSHVLAQGPLRPFRAAPTLSPDAVRVKAQVLLNSVEF